MPNANEPEVDIGLVNLSRASSSTAESSLKSPSSPDLSKRIRHPRQPSRTNSFPSDRKTEPAHAPTPSLDGLFMDPTKVLRLRRWIFGLVVVDFDIDVGPKISSIYPPLDLTPSEALNIAFSSFPDSAQFEQGSQTHSFRIRRAADHTRDPNTPSQSDGFIYGFSHFTQRRDTTSKRGYQQRSVVILTHLPYPSLFHTLIGKLGPSFLSHGGPMLEVACHNIASWKGESYSGICAHRHLLIHVKRRSDPSPDTTVELGFLGSVIQADVPADFDTQQLSPGEGRRSRGEPDLHILASPAPREPPILALLEASLTHLWSIWECVVLCEPVLVFAASPAATSQIVWWLRDLLRPIPLAGDFRPFFTIHDADHTALVNPRPPQMGLLLGVTNPFYSKACGHWPHVLSLGQAASSGGERKQGKDGRADAVGPPPGWTTRTHKRYISKDRGLLKQLEDACRASPHPDAQLQAQREASAALHRHLSARTAALLVPLQRYLQTLIPTPSERAHSSPSPSSPSSLAPSPLLTPTSSRPGTPTPAKSALRLKPFSVPAFLASLKTHGSPLPFRSAGRQLAFYERWVRTPAFGVWLARQEEVVKRVLGG